jgi:hypothetical protein
MNCRALTSICYQKFLPKFFVATVITVAMGGVTSFTPIACVVLFNTISFAMLEICVLNLNPNKRIGKTNFA